MASDEEQVKQHERAMFEREGRPLPESLMTDIERESARAKKQAPPEKENDIFDSKGRDVFDSDGLSIDYDDEDE